MKKDETKEQIKINLNPEKVHIAYTDSIFINVNDDGVTLDICQKVGNSNQIQVISRVGMSKIHAAKFAKKLNEILALTSEHSHSTEKN